LRDDQGAWTRVEILGFPMAVHVEGITETEAFAARRFGRDVHLIQTVTGPEAEAMVERVLELADACEDYGRLVLEWNGEGGYAGRVIAPTGRAYRNRPGPNSNTFVAWLIERTPGLHAELHHNAVGKDYPEGFRLGMSSAGYGVEAELPWIGLGLGLSQGLKLPFLPRLGFAATNL
jgi:hypothetical protein